MLSHSQIRTASLYERGVVSMGSCRHNQAGLRTLRTVQGEVNGFSTVLGPLIRICQRQAAPGRYQHLISGLVQPLNHSRRRNPLVSVTSSPTQETRSQSSIWMLCPLSFHFPCGFFFFVPKFISRDLSKHALTLTPLPPLHVACSTSGLTCASSCFSVSFIVPSKRYFLTAPSTGRYIAFKAIFQLGNWHAYQSNVRNMHPDATTELHTFSWKSLCKMHVRTPTLYLFIFLVLEKHPSVL